MISAARGAKSREGLDQRLLRQEGAQRGGAGSVFPLHMEVLAMSYDLYGYVHTSSTKHMRSDNTYCIR